jgi:hypothetical protein
MVSRAQAKSEKNVTKMLLPGGRYRILSLSGNILGSRMIVVPDSKRGQNVEKSGRFGPESVF